MSHLAGLRLLAVLGLTVVLVGDNMSRLAWGVATSAVAVAAWKRISLRGAVA